jgi:hypothetical protein
MIVKINRKVNVSEQRYCMYSILMLAIVIVVVVYLTTLFQHLRLYSVDL